MDSDAPLAPTVATSTGQPMNPAGQPARLGVEDVLLRVSLICCPAGLNICLVAARVKQLAADPANTLTCVVCCKQQAVHSQLLHALLLMQLVPRKAAQLG
jgi:hypothetical protein